jgi:hypothetical protein
MLGSRWQAAPPLVDSVGRVSSVLATIPHAGDAAVLPAPSDWPRRPAGSRARKGNLPRRRPRLVGHRWAWSSRMVFSPFFLKAMGVAAPFDLAVLVLQGGDLLGLPFQLAAWAPISRFRRWMVPTADHQAQVI